jgi:hypothetical protein
MQEKFTRTYCKSHGISCRISKDGKLSTWSPIVAKYTEVCRNIYTMTENEIRVAIEQHIAIFLH